MLLSNFAMLVPWYRYALASRNLNRGVIDRLSGFEADRLEAGLGRRLEADRMPRKDLEDLVVLDYLDSVDDHRL